MNFLFKRKIFIGKKENGTRIYFDTRENTPLKIRKDELSNSKIELSEIVLLLTLLIWGVLSLFSSASLPISHNQKSFIFFIGVYVFSFLIPLIAFKRSYYKNIDNLVPATESDMREGMKGSSIWYNFLYFKPNVIKSGFLIFSLMVIIILWIYTTLKSGLILKEFYTFGAVYVSEIKRFFLAGYTLSLLFFFLFINNPVRWSNATRLYKQEVKAKNVVKKGRILPLGSVVEVFGKEDALLMIVARACTVEKDGEALTFDYGSVLVPTGMTSSNKLIFFNREDVKKISFKGFENGKEIEFAEKYEDMINS